MPGQILLLIPVMLAESQYIIIMKTVSLIEPTPKR